MFWKCLFKTYYTIKVGFLQLQVYLRWFMVFKWCQGNLNLKIFFGVLPIIKNITSLLFQASHIKKSIFSLTIQFNLLLYLQHTDFINSQPTMLKRCEKQDKDGRKSPENVPVRNRFRTKCFKENFKYILLLIPWAKFYIGPLRPYCILTHILVTVAIVGAINY